MGAAITTSNPADFANRLQTYFSRQLLKELTFQLRLGQYGTAKELPANSAAKTIRFFRPRRAQKGNGTTGPRALTEGVAPTENTEVGVGYVDATLRQRGDITSISDIVQGVDLFDTLQMYHKTMAADAALDFDFVCSHSICSLAGTADADGAPNPTPVGQTTMYGSNGSFERWAGVDVVTNTTSADRFAALAANTASQGRLTRAVHLGAITRLKGVGGKPGVPMINGRYVALTPPEVLSDMRQDSVWLDTAVRNPDSLKLFKWAEFELDGAVFVEHNSPFIETAAVGYGIYGPDGSEVFSNNIYSALYIGQDAFGVPKLSGQKAGSDPRSPSIFVLNKADKADPLNQKTTLGWKAFYQSVLLLTSETTDQPHLVVQRVRTAFNG